MKINARFVFGCFLVAVLIAMMAFNLRDGSRADAERAAIEKRLERQREQERLSAEAKQREDEAAKAAADAKQKAESDARYAESMEKADAEIAAEEAVKGKLTNPATASFGWSTKANKSDDGVWTVTGSVSAKNAFGVEREYEFGCKLKRDGQKWRVLDCQLIE